MNKYLMFNNLVNFKLYLDNDSCVQELKNYFGEYISFQDWDEASGKSAIDLSIVVIEDPNEFLNISSNAMQIDNHLCTLKDKTFYILLEKNKSNKNILFLKRMLSDIVNRFIEIKGGIFLHSSSVVDLDKSIVFIGEKGAGKTTNMLYALNNGKLGYSSNERTGLLKVDNSIVTYGNPSKINIRVNTLEKNEALRKLLWDRIDKEKYKEYRNLLLNRDCSERVVVTFNDICESLNVSTVPFSELGAICNLVYDPTIDFKMEEVEYEHVKDSIYNSIIAGVFEQREKLNEVFGCDITCLDDLLKNMNNVRYYNIYQDNSRDNSKKIMEKISEDMRTQKCLKK